MEKRNINICAVGLLILLLTLSCNHEDASELETMPVQFLIGKQAPVTRATTRENMWNTGDLIAIRNVADAESVPAKQYATTTGGTSVPLAATDAADQFYWNIGRTDMTFEAWYPFFTSKPTTWSVAADQRDNTEVTNTVYNKYDLLYAPPVTPSSGTFLVCQKKIRMPLFIMCCLVIIISF